MLLTGKSTVTRPAFSTLRVQRWRAGRVESTDDRIAEELPIALTYNSIPHVVMMASPVDIEDLGVGFTLSESLVHGVADINSVEVFDNGESLEVRMSIDAECFSALLRQQRNLTGRTGCGLCGAETVEQAIRHPTAVASGPTIDNTELHAALQELTSRQPVNALTGSLHAAAWALPGKGIQLVREDVGRHNALDKVLGALARAGIDATLGYLLITSRASYEMVQKAATLGVSTLAAVSAPTGLAIRLAEQTGLTLIGFARTQQHVVYANPQRLLR